MTNATPGFQPPLSITDLFPRVHLTPPRTAPGTHSFPTEWRLAATELAARPLAAARRSQHAAAMPRISPLRPAVLIASLLFAAAPQVAAAEPCPGACPWRSVSVYGGVGAGEFRFPRGIAADDAGNLYTVEPETHRVQKLDPSGAPLDVWGGFGTGAGKLDHPEDLAVDAAHGAAFVTDTENERIVKYTTSGEFVSAWGWGVDDGSAAYQVCTSRCRGGLRGSGAGQLDNPRGIATDSTYVYVANWGNRRIEKFTTAGVHVSSWTIGAALERPQRLAAAGGKVYAGTTESRVWRFDTSGVPDGAWSGDGAAGGAGEFDYPMGIAVDGGNVYVVDEGNQRIVTLDSSGAFVAAWGTAGAGAGQLRDPGAIVATGGHVWVADSLNHRLQRFSPSGAHELTVGGIGAGDHVNPEDVAIAPSGQVYVVESGSDRIERMSAAGTALSTFGGEGSAPGQFSHPAGIAAGAAGLYVADSGNARVQRLGRAGGFIGAWTGSGLPGGGLSAPADVAQDARGNVYVVERLGNRVRMFDAAGNFLRSWGSAGSAPGQFKYPEGVAVDRAGNVYVADSGNDRVQRFDASGAYLGKWRSDLSYPTGIVTDAAGTVFVADTGHNRILRFDARGRLLAKWGSAGSGPGELSHPKGMAIDASNALWVADYGNHRLQRFCCLRRLRCGRTARRGGDGHHRAAHRSRRSCGARSVTR